MYELMKKSFVVSVTTYSLLINLVFAETTSVIENKASVAAQAQADLAESQNKATTSQIQSINTVNSNTGVSKETLYSGDVSKVTEEQIKQATGNVPKANKISAEAQADLDAAKKNLEQKKSDYEEAQSGLNRKEIAAKEKQLAEAKAKCPNYIPGDEMSTGCFSAEDRQNIDKAVAELQTAKTPKHDYALINKTKDEFKKAELAYIAAGHEAQYGLQTAAGAEALKKAAEEIDKSIKDELKKDDQGNTKAGGIVDIVKKATSANELQKQYEALGKYNEQLQKDIIILILGQVTSRLKSCTPAPDVQLAVGAGQAFVMGEVAEYAQNEYLKEKFEALATKRTEDSDWAKQIEVFRILRYEYLTVLESAKTKQKFRSLSNTAFKNAAALAAAMAVENETWATSCSNQNTNMVSRGSNQGGDNIMMYLAMAAAAYAIPYCGGCAAAAIYMMLKGKSESDKNSCEAGGAATAQKIASRKFDCDMLGTEDMIAPAENPVNTASNYITTQCLARSEEVSKSAGQGCQGYSSNGGGPYSSCDKALDSFRRNMVSCPVSVLTAAKVSTLETSGIASEVGREFVRKASEKVSRSVDLRMASPRQRVIVWSAFAELVDSAVTTNKEMIAVIQSQLTKIEAIIAELESKANGIKLAKTPKSNNLEIYLDKNPNNQLLLKEKTECITSNSPDKCPTTNDALSVSVSFNNLPNEFIDSSMKVAEGLNVVNNTSKISGSDLQKVDVASLENKSIGEMLDKKLKSLEKISSFSKSKNSDFGHESKKYSKNISDTINKLAGKNGLKAFTRSSSATATTALEKPNDGKNDGNEKINYQYNQVGAGGANGFGSQYTGSSATRKSGESKSDLEKTASASSASDLEAESRLNDIIKARNNNSKTKYESNDSKGLFEKVTNAYIRNYDRLLQKKKAPTGMNNDSE